MTLAADNRVQNRASHDEEAANAAKGEKFDRFAESRLHGFSLHFTIV
jgi:hypothetical protein